MPWRSWGAVQSFSGEIAGAIDSLQLALKLDPMLEPNYVFDLAVACYLARRHEDALRIAERGLARYPDFPMFNAPAAAAAAQLGARSRPLAMSRRSAAACPFSISDTLGSRFKDPCPRRLSARGTEGGRLLSRYRCPRPH